MGDDTPVSSDTGATPLDPAASATDTALVTSAPADPDTTTAAPEQAERAPATAADAEQPERRSVVLPMILILIGLGVLIVLFRASK